MSSIRLIRRFFQVLLVTLVGLASVTDAAAQRVYVRSNWIIQALGSLGTGTQSFATAINTRGDIVGYSYLDPGPTGSSAFHAFVWSAGRMRDAGSPGGPDALSFLADINDMGVAVGRYETQVYTYSNGRWSPIGRGLTGDPAAINRSGDIAGVQRTGDDYHAFLYRSRQLFDIGSLGGDTFVSALNDRGTVVGRAFLATGEARAYIYERGRMTNLGALGGQWSAAIDINNQGTVVGEVSDGTRVDTFIYDRGRSRKVAIDPAGSSPKAINNRGDIIGQLPDGGAFLYKGGRVTRLDQLPEVVAAGWSTLFVEDINDRGWIVGYAHKDGDTSRFHAFLLRPR